MRLQLGSGLAPYEHQRPPARALLDETQWTEHFGTVESWKRADYRRRLADGARVLYDPAASSAGSGLR